MKKIYLANSYGFSKDQKEILLPRIVQKLMGLGLEVWEPFERNNQPEILSHSGWAYSVGQNDVYDAIHSDAIFAVVNGCPPDEGVMVELGIAIAHKKPTFLFRDDFRKCTDSENYPLNLMLFAGLPALGWEDYYYKSVEEIDDPHKALLKWARD